MQTVEVIDVPWWGWLLVGAFIGSLLSSLVMAAFAVGAEEDRMRAQYHVDRLRGEE